MVLCCVACTFFERIEENLIVEQEASCQLHYMELVRVVYVLEHYCDNLHWPLRQEYEEWAYMTFFNEVK